MFRFKEYIYVFAMVFLSFFVLRADIVQAVEMLTGCPGVTDNGVTVFEHAYCEGNAVNFASAGTYNLENTSISHYTSSLYVKWGWSAKLTKGDQSVCKNWAGWNFAQDQFPNGSPMNDSITDIQVYNSSDCETPTSTPTATPQLTGCPNITDTGVTLFKDPYCSGESKNFSEAGVYYLPNFNFSEIASSAFVKDGWSVKFYADNVDYCKNWSAWDFGIDTWSDGSSMNDSIRAVQVYSEPNCGAGSETKVLNLFFIPENINPIYNPHDLTNRIIPTMREYSHTKVNFRVVDEITVNRSTTKKADGRMDYNALVSEFDICRKLNSDEIDEVWVWVNGADGAGWEWIISGSYNYPETMNSCGKDLVIMGFDYTRSYDLALHSFGHRMEVLAKANNYSEYIAWDTRDDDYNTPYGSTIPLETGVVGCGNVHFPPNAQSHYDYSNSGQVQSSCTGVTQTISCTAWGCNQEGFMKWWFSYIPSTWWGAFLRK